MSNQYLHRLKVVDSLWDRLLRGLQNKVEYIHTARNIFLDEHAEKYVDYLSSSIQQTDETWREYWAYRQMKRGLRAEMMAALDRQLADAKADIAALEAIRAKKDPK